MKLKKILISIIAVIVMISFLEGGAFVYYGLIKKVPLPQDVLEFSAYRLTRFKPDISFQPGVFSSLQTDQYGFIKNDAQLRNYAADHDGVVRILVLGGSTVVGRGSSGSASTIPSLLEKRLSLKYPAKKFEVINAGVDGYVSFQEFIYLKEIINWLNPQVVVFFDGYNDLFESYAFSPDYCHYKNRMDSNGITAQLDKFVNNLNKGIPLVWRGDVKHYLITHSYFFYRLTTFDNKHKLSSKIDDLLGPVSKSQPTTTCDTASDGYYYQSADEAVLDYNMNLGLAKMITQSKKAVFFSFFQPLIIFKDVNSESEKAFKESFPVQDNIKYEDYAEYFLKQAVALNQQKLGADSFEDMSKIFKNEKNQIFTDRAHYNDKGYEIITEKIFEKIDHYVSLLK